MAVQYLSLFSPQILPNANTILFTVSALALLRNGRIRCSNVTGAAQTVKFWAVPSAGSPINDNVCIPSTSIPANSFIDFDLPVMIGGDKLTGIAGAAASITVCQMDGFNQT